LEDSYHGKFPENDKAISTLFVNKDQGGKHDTFFSYPPYEEIHGKTEKFQEDGALQSFLMVMSGPHNFHKFSELNHILSCFCDPYHDRIVDWLEDSYIKNVQGNGKVVLALFLNDDYKGKCDVFVSYLDALPFLLLMFDFVFIVGLELL